MIAADEATAALRSMFGDDAPAPRATFVTRWLEDPYSYGAYSYVPVGASSRAMRNLSAPLWAGALR